jgi:hypothetical protein
MAIINIGIGAVKSGAGALAQIKGIIASHGYDSDTSALDELTADADRRRQIAAAEKEAQS